eukprot:UN24300
MFSSENEFKITQFCPFDFWNSIHFNLFSLIFSFFCSNNQAKWNPKVCLASHEVASFVH